MEHPPNIYALFEGTVPMAFTSLGAAVLTVLLLSMWVRSAVARSDVIPDGRVSVPAIIELLFEGISNLARDVMGPRWASFMPLVGTLGFFILVSNLMGLVPGGGGPTQFVETNLTWALMAVAVAEIACIREHGFVGWLKHFSPGPIWIAPLIFPIEVFSHLIRIGSLTIRLTANMFADHTLVAIFLTFPFVQFFVPSAIMGMGLFIAFVQAFIFTYLSMSYIGQAL